MFFISLWSLGFMFVLCYETIFFLSKNFHSSPFYDPTPFQYPSPIYISLIWLFYVQPCGTFWESLIFPLLTNRRRGWGQGNYDTSYIIITYNLPKNQHSKSLGAGWNLFYKIFTKSMLFYQTVTVEYWTENQIFLHRHKPWHNLIQILHW